MTISAICAVCGVISGLSALFLKLWPYFMQKHDTHENAEAANDFGKELLSGDDIGASKRLSDELDRVRGQKG